nr:hypothetical protein BaRGS_003251 [Batillaria attramentaria]
MEKASSFNSLNTTIRMTPTDLQVEPPIGPWEQPTKAPVYSVLNKQVNGSLVVNASNLNASEAGVRDEALARVEVAVLTTVFILAVVGNVCVLVALGRKRITSRMHMFIMHLSIADLLVAFCNVLPQLAWDIVGTFHGGDVLCRTVKFLQVFVMYLSTYVLVMTAIDRYRAICYPLSNYHRSSNTVRIMITVAYVLSGVFSIPQPILFKYDTEASNCLSDFGDSPWLLHAYVISFTAAVYIIPFLILAFANYNSCGSQNGRNGVMRPRVHSMRGYSRAKLKTVKVTFVVIVAYLFCWSPFFVSQLWWLFDPSQGNNKAVVIMILLGSLNSCCNPWIYLAFSGNLIRQLLPRAWLCSSCCGSAPTPSNRHLDHIPHTPSASKQRLEMQLLCKNAKDRDRAKGSGAGGHPHKLIGTSMSLLTMRNLGTTRTKTSPTELGAARANILELVRHNDSDDDALEAEVPASVSDGPSALGNVSFCQTPWADNTESCGDGGAGHRTHNGGHVSVSDANADEAGGSGGRV